MNDLEERLLKEAARRHACRVSGRPLGAVTRIASYDSAIGGFLSQGMHVIHGGAGSGKTALAYQIAGTCGVPALFITFEMSVTELAYRLVARTSKVNIRDLRTGQFDVSIVARLWAQAVFQCPELYIADATNGGPAPAEIATAFELITSASEGRGLIVIDSLHHWAEQLSGQNIFEKVNGCVEQITALAARLSCPVVAVNESNRQAGAPKGSSSIEYQAQSVLSLEVAKDQEELESANGELVVKAELTKNRDGRTARFKLLFNGEIQEFTAL